VRRKSRMSCVSSANVAEAEHVFQYCPLVAMQGVRHVRVCGSQLEQQPGEVVGAMLPGSHHRSVLCYCSKCLTRLRVGIKISSNYVPINYLQDFVYAAYWVERPKKKSPFFPYNIINTFMLLVVGLPISVSNTI
jgi:hypothetical protein